MMEKLFYVLACAALYASAAFESVIEEDETVAEQVVA
jgi:hypothetical protein